MTHTPICKQAASIADTLVNMDDEQTEGIHPKQGNIQNAGPSVASVNLVFFGFV